MTLDELLAKCAGVRREGAGWSARCPAHDDRRASLSISEGAEGRLLVHCHAQCQLDAVLVAWGLTPRDLFPEGTAESKIPLAEYAYYDELGTHLYDVVKFPPKEFRQRRADGEWSMRGVRRVLYRLPELTKQAVVYIAEGEKDVNRLWREGLAATCNVGGAGKWKPDLTVQLKAAAVERVVLLPDNDTPGRTHMQQVADSCRQAGLSVKVLGLPVPAKGDVSDWFDAGHTKAELIALVKRQLLYDGSAPLDVVLAAPTPIIESQVGTVHEWSESPAGHRLTVPDLSLTFDLTRIRHEHHELQALLTVRCGLRGAKTVGDQVIHSADFNLSASRTRTERAKILAERSRAPQIDWFGLLEELCMRALAADEQGEQEYILSDLARPEREHGADINMGGLPALRRHPTIWFGAGASAKSLLALHLGIQLAQQGESVLLLDWEFSPEEHRERMAMLVGPHTAVSNLLYRRCDRPLVRDILRLQAIVARHKVTFLIADSVGFACEGPPESAEGATGYFAALRALGPQLGSLHIAHQSSAENGDQKPFGSIFWLNGCRSCWYLKRSDADQRTNDEITVSLAHRKSNLGRLQSARAQRIQFAEDRIVIASTDLLETEHTELLVGLPVWERMRSVLRQHGPMTGADLAERIEATAQAVRTALNRHHRELGRAPDGRLTLLDTTHSDDGTIV